MTLEERIAQVKENIARAAREAGRAPEEVTLVAATKVQSSDTIRQAIAGGITVCGENRVQEMTAHLDDDAYAGAALHFIGHLQTNKVRQVVGRVDSPWRSRRPPVPMCGCGGGWPFPPLWSNRGEIDLFLQKCISFMLT